MRNLVNHAKKEMEIAGMYKDEDGPNKWMRDSVLELIEVFSRQGHSGASAPWCIGLFEKLASFGIISPITGEESEWNEIGTGVLQNKRCSHVFKENGIAYDIEGIIFREKDGCCFVSRDSRVNIKFPYTPTRQYKDV